jgi:hypothetical protein
MVYRVVELGPFGSKIYRGIAETLNDIPMGYEAIRIVDLRPSATVYVEPIPSRRGNK